MLSTVEQRPGCFIGDQNTPSGCGPSIQGLGLLGLICAPKGRTLGNDGEDIEKHCQVHGHNDTPFLDAENANVTMG
jgi:hypothetical protein